MNDFQDSAGLTPGSKGLILSDFNGTLSVLKDGTGFFRDLFVCLIAWKNSGYDVIVHTTSIGSDVEGTIEMMSKIHKVNSDFFEYDLDLVKGKSETDGMDAVAVFDDENITRRGKTGMLLDVNQPHVRAALKRIADDYEASGRTKIITFDPQEFTLPGQTPGNNPELGQ